MRMRLFLGVFYMAAALLTVLTLPFAANGQSLVEDFSTTQYKDPANTTALWDTVAGEIKLFPFEVTLAGTRNTPGSAVIAAVEGDYAYVADASEGIKSSTSATLRIP